MNPDDKILHIISNETKESINQLSVVTPSIFASIFSKFAQDHNQTIENEQELAHDLMAEECSNLTTLQVETSKSASLLSDSTSKAITAIKDKDETILEEVLKETEELRKEIEKLKESIYKDELTNSFNRKWLKDHYTDEDSSKISTSGTLALIDLNYFKLVNDIHGHIIGDKVLMFLANRFMQTDYPVVRYGGDEFIIIFPIKMTKSKVLTLLDDLRKSILSKKLRAHEQTFTVSFSFGVVEFKKDEELAEVIEAADKNMYEDKIAIKKIITGI